MKPQAEPAPPCNLVVFGASGDLTSRLLAPAIYNLRRGELLPENFALLGVARRDESDEGFRQEIGEALQKFAQAEDADEDVEWLTQRMYYLQGRLRRSRALRRLWRGGWRSWARAQATGGNCLFYLATPPSAFAPVARTAREGGAAEGDDRAWRRIIIEKPFGKDLASAKELNARRCSRVADESQIYRIDHYLGKETVQNIMVLRFANGLFEPLWNRDHIDHVQITVAETVGVEQRGKFYDATGALRDMAPNHLFQLLTLTAMEPPSCFSPESAASEKTKVLDAIRPFSPEQARTDVVRAQYGVGVRDGKVMRALSPGGQCRAQFRHRDVRGDEAAGRQLALGRRAVLCPHRQGAGAEADRNRHPVQAGAARPVSRHAGRPPDAQ